MINTKLCVLGHPELIQKEKYPIISRFNIGDLNTPLLEDIWYQLNIDYTKVLFNDFFMDFFKMVCSHQYAPLHSIEVNPLWTSNLCQEIMLYQSEDYKILDYKNILFLLTNQNPKDKEDFFLKHPQIVMDCFYSKNYELMEILLSEGANNDYREEEKLSCLQEALKTHDFDLCKLVIDHLPVSSRKAHLYDITNPITLEHKIQNAMYLSYRQNIATQCITYLNNLILRDNLELHLKNNQKTQKSKV